jgi:hypothetical protein
MWGALYDEKSGMNFNSFLGIASAAFLRSESHGTHEHILLSILRLPQAGGPGSCIYFPQEQVSPVTPSGIEFQVKLKFKLRYGRRSVVQSILVLVSHLELMTRFVFPVLKIADFLIWGALSDERMGL